MADFRPVRLDQVGGAWSMSQSGDITELQKSRQPVLKLSAFPSGLRL